MNNTWSDTKQLDKKTCNNILTKYPAVFDDYSVLFLITVEKGTWTATFDKKKIQTSGLVMNIPIQYANSIKKMLDHA